MKRINLSEFRLKHFLTTYNDDKLNELKKHDIKRYKELKRKQILYKNELVKRGI